VLLIDFTETVNPKNLEKRDYPDFKKTTVLLSIRPVDGHYISQKDVLPLPIKKVLVNSNYWVNGTFIAIL